MHLICGLCVPVVSQLDGDAELSTEEKGAVLDLALSWDLPGVTERNRRWLHERLLLHAVSTIIKINYILNFCIQL